ncbi:hypothetical protein GCM10009609_44620 [Pseudonocardia aurantiaca]
MGFGGRTKSPARCGDKRWGGPRLALVQEFGVEGEWSPGDGASDPLGYPSSVPGGGLKDRPRQDALAPFRHSAARSGAQPGGSRVPVTGGSGRPCSACFCRHGLDGSEIVGHHVVVGDDRDHGRRVEDLVPVGAVHSAGVPGGASSPGTGRA